MVGRIRLQLLDLKAAQVSELHIRSMAADLRPHIALAGCDFHISIFTNIQTAMPIIMIFSVSDTNPSGTFELPPTHAHFKSRLWM